MQMTKAEKIELPRHAYPLVWQRLPYQMTWYDEKRRLRGWRSSRARWKQQDQQAELGRREHAPYVDKLALKLPSGRVCDQVDLPS